MLASAEQLVLSLLIWNPRSRSSCQQLLSSNKFLKGHGTEAQKTVTSINAGAAIQTFHPERSLHYCYLEARAALDDGRALNAFTQLLNTA